MSISSEARCVACKSSLEFQGYEDIEGNIKPPSLLTGCPSTPQQEGI